MLETTLRLGLCHAALAALALVGFACGPDKSEPDPWLAIARPTPPSGPAPQHFTFETGDDTLSQALRDATASYHRAPRTQEELTALRAQEQAALAELQRNGAETATRLIANYQQLVPADLDGRDTLLHLLGAVDDPAALAFLRDESLKPTPPYGDVDAGLTLSETGVTTLVRLSAVQLLSRRAAAGNSAARGYLLEAVQEGAPDVRAAAIAGVYAASPTRFKAREEMKRLLPPDQRYLLYKLF